MPYHILAKPEDIADKVIVVGNPERAKFISNFLDKRKLVNENRGLLTYTGTWNGMRLTIATHGMGGSGAAIVFEELIELGAKILIRLGTTGSIREEINSGDIIVPCSAYHYPGGLFKMYADDVCGVSVPDFSLLERIVSECKKCIVGPVFSSEGFYAERRDLIEKWAKLGALSVEMECATLFTISRIRKVKAGAMLLVNGSLIKGERLIKEETLLDKLENMVLVALRTLAKL